MFLRHSFDSVIGVGFETAAGFECETPIGTGSQIGSSESIKFCDFNDAYFSGDIAMEDAECTGYCEFNGRVQYR